ncbi:hypothetical protein BDN70DRAFT_593411 [Pholiota conissans]|uniref:Uncharacterized protein n=1 Tax=Pholiota conissans TaxID=109636 RepID=A0A9P6D6H4_9AGAR|nr:hypothetical protein BDN70DRAFT_593411 [Pholiota conissans]
MSDASENASGSGSNAPDHSLDAASTSAMPPSGSESSSRNQSVGASNDGSSKIADPTKAVPGQTNPPSEPDTSDREPEVIDIYAIAMKKLYGDDFDPEVGPPLYGKSTPPWLRPGYKKRRDEDFEAYYAKTMQKIYGNDADIELPDTLRGAVPGPKMTPIPDRQYRGLPQRTATSAPTPTSASASGPSAQPEAGPSTARAIPQPSMPPPPPPPALGPSSASGSQRANCIAGSSSQSQPIDVYALAMKKLYGEETEVEPPMVSDPRALLADIERAARSIQAERQRSMSIPLSVANSEPTRPKPQLGGSRSQIINNNTIVLGKRTREQSPASVASFKSARRAEERSVKFAAPATQAEKKIKLKSKGKEKVPALTPNPDSNPMAMDVMTATIKLTRMLLQAAEQKLHLAKLKETQLMQNMENRGQTFATLDAQSALDYAHAVRDNFVASREIAELKVRLREEELEVLREELRETAGPVERAEAQLRSVEQRIKEDGLSLKPSPASAYVVNAEEGSFQPTPPPESGPSKPDLKGKGKAKAIESDLDMMDYAMKDGSSDDDDNDDAELAHLEQLAEANPTQYEALMQRLMSMQSFHFLPISKLLTKLYRQHDEQDIEPRRWGCRCWLPRHTSFGFAKNAALKSYSHHASMFLHILYE